MGKVIVIVSAKGGVGKSSIAAGLGLALSKKHLKVLLIDGDAGFRSLDCLLGISKNVVFDMADIVNGNCRPQKAVYRCGKSNLYLIPAPQNAKDVVSPQILKQIVSPISKIYDYVIIDAPTGFDSGFYSSIAPAQMALIVSSTDPVCVSTSDKVRQELCDNNKFSSKNFKKLKEYNDLDEVIDIIGTRLISIIPKNDEVFHKVTIGESKFIKNLAERLIGNEIRLEPNFSKY